MSTTPQLHQPGQQQFGQQQPYGQQQQQTGLQPIPQHVQQQGGMQGMQGIQGMQGQQGPSTIPPQFGQQGFGSQGFGPQGFGSQGFGPQQQQQYGQPQFGQQQFGQQQIPQHLQQQLQQMGQQQPFQQLLQQLGQRGQQGVQGAQSQVPQAQVPEISTQSLTLGVAQNVYDYVQPLPGQAEILYLLVDNAWRVLINPLDETHTMVQNAFVYGQQVIAFYDTTNPGLILGVAITR
ncbi:hypothetical protein [Streptomyces longispororuber]|uniref:hypothetical protein n=1 Tax=Streptomyces longispororuber TaxID=68230 RepID=UPI0021094692|nr:hypothetical protein [Streptomyces longispororuber]MCQ4210685.1 hypothetical protein [Streptomyces longispororuber]